MRVIRRLANSRELTLFVLVVLLAVAMSDRLPEQFPDRLQHRAPCCSTSRQSASWSAGMMLLMIAGTFDLSVGSTLALAGVWAGVVAGWWGWPPQVGLVVGIAGRRAVRASSTA